jgi:biotin synthase
MRLSARRLLNTNMSLIRLPAITRPPPKVEVYRRVQLARYLIANGPSRIEDMSFDDDGRIVDFGISKAVLEKIVDSGEPFFTSGCLDCNRPFYNEKLSGPIYNYPRPMTTGEIEETKRMLVGYHRG